MKHIITVTIDGEDTDENDIHNAGLVREEIVGAVEDFVERERPTMNVSVGSLEKTESDRHKMLIELARERHAYASDGEITLDDDARISEGNDGTYVAAWVWVPRDVIDGVDSEGGHCD